MPLNWTPVDDISQGKETLHQRLSECQPRKILTRQVHEKDYVRWASSDSTNGSLSAPNHEATLTDKYNHSFGPNQSFDGIPERDFINDDVESTPTDKGSSPPRPSSAPRDSSPFQTQEPLEDSSMTDQVIDLTATRSTSTTQLGSIPASHASMRLFSTAREVLSSQLPTVAEGKGDDPEIPGSSKTYSPQWSQSTKNEVIARVGEAERRVQRQSWG